MPDLMLEDIQGIILSGYGYLSQASYVCLQVADHQKAKRWLAGLIGEITTAARWDKANRPQTSQNIAFTSKGLAALGLPDDVLQTFSAEFQEGMAEPRRAKLMGDTGDGAPETWEMGGPHNPEIHLLLLLFAQDDGALAVFRDRQRARFAEGGLQEIGVLDAYRPRTSKEHFGFFDGISQPIIEDRGQKGVKPGEFVFGYPNEYGLKSPVPGADALKSDVLGKNGSYMICRKLTQDVGAFHHYLQQNTDGSREQMDWLGAKMVGRWPSGAPLVLAPEKDDPALAGDMTRANDFKFANEDPYGYACPVGSHIRRANPRDSLEPDPPSSLMTVNRHRIIRRGRSYGPLYSEAAAGEPRGVFFIAINADIKRQFEFIQEAWLNDERFAGLYDNKDPIAGDRSPKCPTNMVIQRAPVRKEYADVPRFVTTRGGGYFFLPSITALKYIADRP